MSARRESRTRLFVGGIVLLWFAASVGCSAVPDAQPISSPATSTVAATSTPPRASAAPLARGLTVSENGRYLVDRNGVPFRIQGDAAWSMIANLTHAEANEYLDDRKAKGFNTVLVNLIEHHFAVNAPANRRGDQPFVRPGDFSTPNEAYFSFADSIIDLAADKNMVVMLSYMYLGTNSTEGWRTELNSPLNSPAVCYQYGMYLGNRYKDRSNIIWVAGGDDLPQAGSQSETRLLRIMEGIKAAGGASRLHTSHWIPDRVSTDNPAFEDVIDLNAAYSYNAPYRSALAGYIFRPAIPTFLIETGYEAEDWSPGDPASVRNYEYGAYLSGIGGVFYGHRDIWEFATDTWWSGFSFGHRRWQLSLNTPGALDMMRMGQLLDSIPWWNLVPSNTPGMKRLVASGGGTYGSSGYVTAAATPDGTVLLAYVPSTGSAATTISIDMTAMSGPVRARWFNPTSGVKLDVASSLPTNGTRQFTTPGNNGTGANDWTLILDRV